MVGREVEENVSLIYEDHNILWCVGIIYQGVVKKQWQKSKKIKKNRDMILHLIQPTKIAYFRVKIKRVKLFDNQENKKQYYLLMHFSKKKEKNGLEKKGVPTGEKRPSNTDFSQIATADGNGCRRLFFLFKLNAMRNVSLNGRLFR